MDVLIECGFVGLLQQSYLVSGDTGWSLQILFPDYNFIGSASKGGSILTAYGAISHTPKGEG